MTCGTKKTSNWCLDLVTMLHYIPCECSLHRQRHGTTVHAVPLLQLALMLVLIQSNAHHVHVHVCTFNYTCMCIAVVTFQRGRGYMHSEIRLLNHTYVAKVIGTHPHPCHTSAEASLGMCFEFWLTTDDIKTSRVCVQRQPVEYTTRCGLP